MKFVITAAQRAALMAELDPILRPDANADETAYYPIVNLYYDNPERDCYWEKIRGIRNRRKLRVRVYGSLDGSLPPTSFIEVKHKQEGRGVKRRVQMPYQEALRVGQGYWPEGINLRETDKRTIQEIHDLLNRRKFAPVMVMRYDRRAYASSDPTSDLRITYDTGIAYRMRNLNPVPDDRDFQPADYMYPSDISVLEVKVTGSIPYRLSKLLPEAGCRLQSHSKYCNALEANDPVLREMLAPNWRKPLPNSGDTEMDMVTGAESTPVMPEPIIAPAVG
jgi:hypothetical protein